ncbi:2-oxo acid dehydrogenase subunit E2 [Microbispora sp. ATCC PTA-5024]|uniref:2-oxo acid dehydrogenase subunit E2 n=1 Tax=Microbispora sp. ATCC PTA-5024 TaxID=316330 RepID=UPI0003DC8A7C|nr:2-oxo acid dehydrogenase subunit E2 [Microbispora sp. ATCC PTA-5024]ETK37310.1 hypothetical protein MPTA5024_04560 [Microbispora sp. ATCC PTA-5024]
MTEIRVPELTDDASRRLVARLAEAGDASEGHPRPVPDTSAATPLVTLRDVSADGARRTVPAGVSPTGNRAGIRAVPAAFAAPRREAAATDGVVRRAVHRVVRLGLAHDHRMIDGREAARFLGAAGRAPEASPIPTQGDS